ncbi:hypothetical protein MQE36_16180 [Zhouia spongiae]|uniref:Uncharacterized protein n=1 Tax=Zhouia spongiae TaxID=2202721 RepID=A0ABY3YLW4_9FLAO|nr:hypothetical protein [Zhouia spongiae]UNY98605.1 hypothetical protein MQE36_16180 [Zhouia spongiae]
MEKLINKHMELSESFGGALTVLWQVYALPVKIKTDGEDLSGIEQAIAFYQCY